MLLQKIIKTCEDVFLIEDSFDNLEMNLKSLDYLDKLRYLPKGAIKSALIINNKQGTPVASAFKNKHPEGDFWFILPYPVSPVMRKQTENMITEILNSGIVLSVKTRKVDEEAFNRAIREYLSISLAEGAFCDCNKVKEPLSFVLNSERNTRILSLMSSLAKEHGYDLKGIDALEICCGNGMSTAAVRPLFKSVLSVDNDKCAVCNGLYYNILEPSNTMVADASGLSRIIRRKYGAVIGFMLGAIYEFNKPLWREILKDSVRMLDKGGFLLITVNQREEMDFLVEAFHSMGIEGQVQDNRDETSIYDGWVFFAMPDKTCP